jgi:hypothetical protein
MAAKGLLMNLELDVHCLEFSTPRLSLSLVILISIPTHWATFHRQGDIDTQLIFRQRLQAGSSKFSMSFS